MRRDVMKDLKYIPAVTALAIIFSFMFLLPACSKPRSVSDVPLTANGLKSEISVASPPVSLKQNSTISIKVKIKNAGSAVWPGDGKSGGKYPINLAYHWLDKGGKILILDGMRTALPYNLKPGEDVTVDAKVAVPLPPGQYILEFDIVQELVAWFGDKGNKTARLNVTVE